MNTGRNNRMHFSVAIIVIGLGLVGLVPAAYGADAKGTYEETVEQLLPFNSGASLSLEGRNGSVKVRVWDRNEIKIVAKKRMKVGRAHSWLARLIGLKTPKIESEEDARAFLEQFTMEINGDADRLEVRTKRPPSAGHLNFSMSYEVVLPRDSEVSVRVTNGRIEITGVSGNVTAAATNGRITCHEISGALHARTTNGRIEFDGVRGELEARTTNGAISGRLAQLPARGSEVICRTTNGRIQLTVPRDSDFEVAIQSNSSRVSSDFNLHGDLTKRPKRLRGIVGEGGPLISLRSTNGAVDLEAM